MSPGDSPKTIFVQEVSETHFLVSSFQGFVLVNGKFPIVTQGLTSFPDSGVPESLPRPGGWWDDQAERRGPVLYFFQGLWLALSEMR